jgi:SAM-dependent methyltransferase
MSESPNRWLQSRTVSGEAYDATYERRAAAGEDVHGEANFVERFAPASVLDAGCGTGRVGRELARRGIDVVGVDIDPEMLAVARAKGPEADWRLADLGTVELGRTFDAIVMAGNVMIFLAPGSEGRVVENLVRHLAPGGVLIAGFQVQAGRLSIGRYDEIASEARLTLMERWATWDRGPWQPGGSYALSVHSKQSGTGAYLCGLSSRIPSRQFA